MSNTFKVGDKVVLSQVSICKRLALCLIDCTKGTEYTLLPLEALDFDDTADMVNAVCFIDDDGDKITVPDYTVVAAKG